jgi:hypothetical protein
MTHGGILRREHLRYNTWGMTPHVMQMHQLAVMQAASPDKSLNAILTGCTTIPSTSTPTLPYASSARGTQAPPTTISSLDLGPSVVGKLSTRAGQDNIKLLRGDVRRPGVNSHARPRDDFHDQVARLHFNAP